MFVFAIYRTPVRGSVSRPTGRNRLTWAVTSRIAGQGTEAVNRFDSRAIAIAIAIGTVLLRRALRIVPQCFIGTLEHKERVR